MMHSPSRVEIGGKLDPAYQGLRYLSNYLNGLNFILFYGMRWAIAAGIFLSSFSRAEGECLPGARVNFGSFPVVMIGAERFVGTDIHRIGFFQYEKAKKAWAAIDVQVDERNANGDLVLDGGLPFTKNTDNGIFDSNDEISTMFENWGDDFDFGAITPEIASLGLLSWKVHGCSGNHYIGSVLAMLLKQPRAENERTPVKFDANERTIRTSLYRYQFNPKRAALLGQVFVSGADGETAIFQDSQFRMPLATPWFVPDVTLSDENFISEIESWQIGPVRTIVAVGVKLRKFLALFNLHMFSELVFYKNSFQIPTKIEFVFSPKQYLKIGSGIAYAVSLTKPKDWQISTNLENLPVQAGDRAVVPQGNSRAIYVANGRGKDIGFSIRVSVDPEASRQAPPPYFISAEAIETGIPLSNWQGLSGLKGDLGIFVDFSGVRAGLYDFGLDLVLSSGAEQAPTQVFEPQSFTWVAAPSLN